MRQRIIEAGEVIQRGDKRLHLGKLIDARDDIGLKLDRFLVGCYFRPIRKSPKVKVETTKGGK